MTPALTVSPGTSAPGTTVDVTGSGFDPKAKYDLTTVDAKGTESGKADGAWTAAQDRPKRDGTFSTGIFAPPVEGPATIRAYQHGVVVASAPLTVASVVVPPPPPPPTGQRVTTVVDLLTALADDVPSIVMANGSYQVSTAGTQSDGTRAPASLWIGARFAGRKNPALVQAETKGGVVFDGGGASYFGGISFNEGAHDQVWDGFTFANGVVTETGLITLGGYPTPAAHHITMRNIKVPTSVKGSGSRYQGKALDHAVYIGHSGAAIHDLAFEDFDIDAGGGLASGFQLYGAPGAYNVAFRRFRIANAMQALLIYEASLRNIAFEDGTIVGSSDSAVTYVHPAEGITLTRVNSTGTPGGKGLYAPEGTSGLTLVGSSLQ